MGETGQQRLELYTKLAKKKGYESLSAYIVDLADKDLGVDLPKPKTRQVKSPRRK
jgi:hypothetical protein